MEGDKFNALKAACLKQILFGWHHLLSKAHSLVLKQHFPEKCRKKFQNTKI